MCVFEVGSVNERFLRDAIESIGGFEDGITHLSKKLFVEFSKDRVLDVFWRFGF